MDEDKSILTQEELDNLDAEEIEEIRKAVKRKKRHRRSLLKLNLMSLFFTAVSFISVTLAWFAYSGLVTTQTEVDVKAWYIEFNQKGKAVSNNIVIALNDIYPGMDIMSEVIDIKNNGDSNAMISYKLKSVRILDETYDVSDPLKLEDELSHKYPFHINMSLSNHYAKAIDGSGTFAVSVSWPLDSESETVESDFGDANDTLWGTKAYQFQSEEAKKANADKNYQMKSSIEIVISLEAVQYIGEGDAPDSRFSLGQIVLYNPIDNIPCDEISPTCLKTYVIDTNNKMSDGSVHLLPDINTTYANGLFTEYDVKYNDLTSKWTTVHRKLSVKDIIPVISTDITSSVLVAPDISNQLIGNTNYPGRVDTTINNVKKYSGYLRFKNDKYPYITNETCYWLADEYNTSNQFALTKADESYSKIYPESKSKTDACKIIPVMEVSKSSFIK